ncbi:MAG TPA: hypothetical protein VLA77_04625 [Candidatus Saccharimonadales bacterium]|nr:hypothetical protein [Candidatus Saccharimonadales bacterium]
MPSFFETLGRIVSGKPAFVPEDSLQPQNPQIAGGIPGQGSTQAEQHIQSGPKVIKKAHITEVECYNNGAGFECWASVHNGSNDRLDLNQLEFLGQSTDLQTILMPGEERKFKIYQGPHIRSASQTVCNLEYIDSVGDYFVANHNVEFRQLADGTHEVDRIKFVQIWDK